MLALLYEVRDYLPRGTSLKDKIPNYEAKIAAIEEKIFTIDEFASEYKRAHGSYPTIREVLQKILVGHQDIIRQVKKLRRSDPKVAYFVDETVSSMNFGPKEKEKFEKFIEEYADLLDTPFNPKSKRLHEVRGLVAGLWKNPYGDLGELLAALHLQGVEVQNLHLRIEKNKAIGPRINPHRNKVVEATERAFERLEQATPEAIESWKHRFPMIFTEKRSVKMENVKNWLESKEVDLVTKGKEGKYYFVEVKNYTMTMTLDILQDSPYGGKTIWDQQMEMKEIIEFLELDTLYTPAITFIKGVDEEAARKLEQAGIMVIPYPEI